MNLTIRIPGKIDPNLNPNSHKHWLTKHAAQTDAHMVAKYAALDLNLYNVLPRNTSFAYDVTIGLAKGEKVKDDDNAAAMTKHYRDGIAAGLGCADDKGWRFQGVEQVRDPEGVGFIEFRLTEIAEQEDAA